MLSIGIRHLEYAIAVAKYGSVTDAAAQIHVSQPALSVAIAKLEEQLGNSLFIRRKGSPLTLTAFGRNFISNSTELVDRFEALITPRGELMADQTVVVGFYEDLAPLISGSILAEVKAGFPSNELLIRSGTFDYLTEELLAGRIDFAVTYNLGVDISFDTNEIAVVHPHLLLYPDHPLVNQKKINLRDVALEPLVLVNQKQSLSHLMSIFLKYKLEPKIVYRASSFEIMRSMVANGQGIGISYTRSKSSESYDGKNLVYRWIDDIEFPAPVIIVSNNRNPLSATAKLYIEMISDLPVWKVEKSFA